jgi:hypothetical protein
MNQENKRSGSDGNRSGPWSKHPDKEKDMNVQTITTAMPMGQENICDHVDRLTRDLSEALPKWANGQFMAMVYPDGDARGYWFRSIHRTEQGEKDDPIIEAINAYKDGIEQFSELPEDDTCDLNHLWKEPWTVLAKWDQPCKSRDGAIAALKLAIFEEDIGESQLTAPLIQAALSYIEREVQS